MRLKAHSLVRHLAQFGEAENLKSATVRQDGSGPPCEPVQSTHLSHDLMPRPQIQVVGVVQDETKAELLQVGWINPLYRPQRTNRDEGRRIDLAMGGAEFPQPRARLTIHPLN